MQEVAYGMLLSSCSLASTDVTRTIAVTPSKLKTVTPEESAKISRDYAVTAIDTISHLARPIDSKTPLRFIYMSGANAERDPAKKPWVLGDNALMRVSSSVLISSVLIRTSSNRVQGEAESRILEYAEKSNGAVEAAVAKPGLIVYPGKTGAVMTFVQDMARSLISLPKVDLSEASAALLHQCINGFEKETLLNEDLARIGQSELARQAAS